MEKYSNVIVIGKVPIEEKIRSNTLYIFFSTGKKIIEPITEEERIELISMLRR